MNSKDRHIITESMILFLAVALSLLPFEGCMYRKKPLKLVELDVPSYLFVLQAPNNVNVKYVENSEITFVFDGKLSENQNVHILYANASNWKVVKPLSVNKNTVSPELSYRTEGNKIVVNWAKPDEFVAGAPIFAFFIPKGLKSVHGRATNTDITVYQTCYAKNKGNFIVSGDGVQPIVKRKNDKKKIGFYCDIETMNLTKKLFTNPPASHYLVDKEGGKNLLELKNGDSFEILGESGNFYMVRAYYKENTNSEIKPITGFIDKKFVFLLPPPLNDNSFSVIYPKRINGVVVEYLFTRDETYKIKALPYFPELEVHSPFGWGGESLSCPGVLPLTSDKEGVIEVANFAHALRMSFPPPSVLLPNGAMNKEDFVAIGRFYKQCSYDMTKIINEFVFPDDLKSVKPYLIGLTKKDIVLNDIYFSWVSSCAHKDITAKDVNNLIEELSDKIGRSSEEKDKIKRMFGYPISDSTSKEGLLFVIDPKKGSNAWLYLVNMGNKEVEEPIRTEREKVFYCKKR